MQKTHTLRWLEPRQFRTHGFLEWYTIDCSWWVHYFKKVKFCGGSEKTIGKRVLWKRRENEGWCFHSEDRQSSDRKQQGQTNEEINDLHTGFTYWRLLNLSFPFPFCLVLYWKFYTVLSTHPSQNVQYGWISTLTCGIEEADPRATSGPWLVLHFAEFGTFGYLPSQW